jgi:hypothetical protein
MEHIDVSSPEPSFQMLDKQYSLFFCRVSIKEKKFSILVTKEKSDRLSLIKEKCKFFN